MERDERGGRETERGWKKEQNISHISKMCTKPGLRVYVHIHTNINKQLEYMLHVHTSYTNFIYWAVSKWYPLTCQFTTGWWWPSLHLHPLLGTWVPDWWDTWLTWIHLQWLLDQRSGCFCMERLKVAGWWWACQEGGASTRGCGIIGGRRWTHHSRWQVGCWC